jgi:hypothetical protein
MADPFVFVWVRAYSTAYSHLPQSPPEQTMHAKLLPRLMSTVYKYTPISQTATEANAVKDNDSIQHGTTRRKKLRSWFAAILVAGWVIFLLFQYVVFKKPTAPSPWTGWSNIRYMFVLYFP